MKKLQGCRWVLVAIVLVCGVIGVSIGQSAFSQARERQKQAELYCPIPDCPLSKTPIPANENFCGFHGKDVKPVPKFYWMDVLAKGETVSARALSRSSELPLFYFYLIGEPLELTLKKFTHRGGRVVGRIKWLNSGVTVAVEGEVNAGGLTLEEAHIEEPATANGRPAQGNYRLSVLSPAVLAGTGSTYADRPISADHPQSSPVGNQFDIVLDLGQVLHAPRDATQMLLQALQRPDRRDRLYTGDWRYQYGLYEQKEDKSKLTFMSFDPKSKVVEGELALKGSEDTFRFKGRLTAGGLGLELNVYMTLHVTCSCSRLGGLDALRARKTCSGEESLWAIFSLLLMPDRDGKYTNLVGTVHLPRGLTPRDEGSFYVVASQVGNSRAVINLEGYSRDEVLFPKPSPYRGKPYPGDDRGVCPTCNREYRKGNSSDVQGRFVYVEQIPRYCMYCEEQPELVSK